MKLSKKKYRKKSYGSKKTKQKFVKKNLAKKKGGGSSDWRSTVYSRGSYTAPNMDQKQFKAFTKTAEYLPNESMRTTAFMK